MQSPVQFLQGSKELSNLVPLRFRLQFGTLVVTTIEIMTQGDFPRIFEGMDDRSVAAIAVRPTMSLLTSLATWCPAIPLPLGVPFAASSAVADATSQAELGTSAPGNGRHGEHDRSNRRQNRSSARRLWSARLRRESYSRYHVANDPSLLIG